MIKQKEAVFSAIASVLANSGRQIVDGTPVELSDEEHTLVTEIVASGIFSGEVAYGKGAVDVSSLDRAAVTRYVGGMVGNWLSKDLRLNGGTKHEVKNPGSRTGQSDEMIRNLRALLKTTTNDSDRAAVEARIEARKLELDAAKPAKAKKAPKVDFSKIPADLLSSLNLG